MVDYKTYWKVIYLYNNNYGKNNYRNHNYGSYNNYDYRQQAQPLYMKPAQTNKIYMKYNNQWFEATDPNQLMQDPALFTCNCCVYRDPGNFNNSVLEHASGECPRTHSNGWPLEATYYNCDAWHC